MNISINLDKDFSEKFNELREKYGDEVAKLNGFSDEQLSYTDFIDNFVDKNTVADASIDGNANVGAKDICSLDSEMNKPHSKLLSFNKVYYEMKKKYGKDIADRWLEYEWIGKFYAHDSPSLSQKSYCFAYDLEGLVNKGLYFVPNFNGQPPKHLVTYTDFVGEFVSYASNRSSGACGLPSFLVYSFYFWIEDVKNGYYTGTPERYRDQEFQRITYKLNQPYLRVNQSAFTNFSIFDRPYFEALFGYKTFPNGEFIIDYIEEFMEYQKAFMKVVSDIREVNMMTFPVLSFCLLRKNGKFVDEDFARWCCKHNMKWADSNFFVSEDVTSLSNCCFSGNTMFVTTNGIKRFDSFNDGDRIVVPCINGTHNNATVHTYGEQRLFNIKLKRGKKYKDVLVTRNHRWILENGKETHHLDVGDVLVKVANDSEDGCWTVVDITDTGRIETVWCLDVENEHNFILADNVSCGNCRLVSDVKQLGYFNSIGSTALEVGSVKVNTINLARIAYETKSKEEYLKQLSDEVVLCLQMLDVVRHIIQRNIEKGLLPNYSYGLMHMKSQYNTIGIVALYETLQKFGMTYKDKLGYAHYTDEGVEFAKEILHVINKVKDEFVSDKDYSANIEQIPAERAASILMQKDMVFFPDEAYDLPLYGNQWIPLGVKTTLEEKCRLSAILDKACNGGSIAHINIDAPFTNFDTAWDMLNYVADSGVPYFAFCTRISACEENHGFYGDKCPICGKPKVTTYQRVVGFLTPEKTYSKERKAEFKMRDWFDLNAICDTL